MSAFSNKKQLLGLITWLFICFLTAAIGAIASLQAESFYGQLIQPSWAPPATVFAPVWTILFTMMAIAAWLVWRQGDVVMPRTALLLFLLQLAFNALWSWLFFTWHLGALALANIAILWLLIVATIAAFWRVKPVAGGLLIPYLLWVSFAFTLNFVLWQLNPEVLG